MRATSLFINCTVSGRLSASSRAYSYTKHAASSDVGTLAGVKLYSSSPKFGCFGKPGPLAPREGRISEGSPDSRRFKVMKNGALCMLKLTGRSVGVASWPWTDGPLPLVPHAWGRHWKALQEGYPSQMSRAPFGQRSAAR